MKAKNAIYAQSGGVTSVINTTACGVIEAARKSEHWKEMCRSLEKSAGLREE